MAQGRKLQKFEKCVDIKRQQRQQRQEEEEEEEIKIFKKKITCMNRDLNPGQRKIFYF